MSKKIKLIDCSTVAIFAPHFTPKGINTVFDISGGMMHQYQCFLSYLKKVHEIDYHDHTFCIFDNATPTFRDILYLTTPEHSKINFKEIFKIDQKYIQDNLLPLRDYVEILGIKILDPKGMRSIDAISFMVKYFSKIGYEVDIFSCDRSFLNLIDDNIKLIDLQKNTIIDNAGINKIYPVKSSQITDFHSLFGDATIGFPSITSLKYKAVERLFKNHNSLLEILTSEEELPIDVRKNKNQIKKLYKSATAKKTAKLNITPQLLNEKINIASKDYDLIYEDFIKKHLPIDLGISYLQKLTKNWIQLRKRGDFLSSNRHMDSYKFTVYRIKNKISQKVYFGSSTEVDHRWNSHKLSLNRLSHSNPLMNNEAKTFGPESFEFKVISRHKTKEEMLMKEQLLIAMHYGRSICYNYRMFVESENGLPFSLVIYISRKKDAKFSLNNLRIYSAENKFGTYLSVHAAKRDLRISSNEILSSLTSQPKITGQRIYFTNLIRDPNISN
jgi:5'-3' exonuclease